MMSRPKTFCVINYKGGTGKTCTAVATKSLTWEKEDYTILWVTRTTLRADIWKNMFEKVCDSMIREKLEKGIKIPEGKAGRKESRELRGRPSAERCVHADVLRHGISRRP